MELQTASGPLSLDHVVVMGVLNVTPDSFSDGGLWIDPDRAVAPGLEMAKQGAAMIDVGGESTRPGAEPVPEDEELKRVRPVIEGLKAATETPLSIDTRKPEVARRALEAGAAILNDTRGEEADPEMDALAAETGAGVCVMHSRGTPATMRSLAEYRDVVREVASFLSRRTAELEERGVAPGSIAIDPGIGFAKTPDQNLEILDRLDELAHLGYPLLVGTSRKSFIGAVLDLPETERLEGTIATVVWAIAKGAKIVRVHDGAATRDALAVWNAVNGKS